MFPALFLKVRVVLLNWTIARTGLGIWNVYAYRLRHMTSYNLNDSKLL